MKLKFLFLFIAQVAASNILFAQNKIIPLKRGDVVPENLSFGKIINFQSETAKISDFKGKLIILDFWGTTCTPCVAALPKLDSLQAKFKNQIAIIPVTFEPEEMIAAFFKKKNFTLPSVVENRELEKLFPFRGAPFEVWIDHNGKVIATTSDSEVNEKNIKRYLDSGILDVKQRVDVLDVKFDQNEDLFVNGNGGVGHFLWRSILTDQIEGLTGNMSIIKRPLTKSKLALSATAYHLYSEVLYMSVLCLNPTLFFTELNNSEIKEFGQKSITDAFSFFYGNITPEKVYCYNLDVPLSVSDSLLYRKYMLEDLNRYFGLDVRVEKRRVPSWILFKAGNGINCLASKTDTNNSMIVVDDEIERNYYEKVQNMPFNGFLAILKTWWYMAPPMFDETGYANEKVNLNNLHIRYNKDKASYNLLNLEEWRSALRLNGLDIRVEDREVEVMIFKKKENLSK